MTNTPPGTERRHHHRFPFGGIVHIRINGYEWTAPLLDISFKGILVEWAGGPHDINPDQPCQLELELSDGALDLTMEGTVVHMENGHIGFRITHLDIESATHLRRLVELNLGDDSLLQREIEALVTTNPNQAK